MHACRAPKPELLSVLLSSIQKSSQPHAQNGHQNGFAVEDGVDAKLPNGNFANGHAANGSQNGHAPVTQVISLTHSPAPLDCKLVVTFLGSSFLDALLTGFLR